MTQYLYDKLNRQTQVILPNGDTTTYGYDDNNNRTSLLDDAGNLTVFAYDTRNRLGTETNQLAAARTYTYDHNGNRLTATDRNGRLREFDYDYLNRLADEKWLDAGAAVVYTNTLSYNADGTLASNVDVAGPAGTGAPISAYTYLYDGLGRLTSVDNLGTDVPWHVVLASFDSTTGESYYDANGNRTGLRATIDGVADFENVYEYDKINRPDTIIQQSHGGNVVAPKRADFIYDAASRLQNINTYAAVTTTAMVNSTTYTVDPSGRLTYLSHFQPGTSNTILYGWGYDRSNRVTSYSRNDTGGLSESQTYNYDDAGQLTGSTGTLNENYTYDANGNRTNTGYSTPAGSDNRLATDGTYSYAYDAEGNLILRTEVATPGNARVFEYDYRNRLVAVRDYTGYVDALNPGTLVMEAEYTYDAGNLRIKKVVDIDGAGPASAVTTGFVYDEGHVVLQFDGTAGMTNRYLYGPAVDQVLADERASGVLWALADNLGSVRDLVDSGGTPVNHVKYSAFGEKVFESAPATNFLFGYTGAVFDAETNLGYHRARYLDHATGRWINQDPIQFAAGDANLYRYVGNEPTNATDPSGLYTLNFRTTNRSTHNKWTQADKSRVVNSFERIRSSLPDLISEANREYRSLSDCVKERLGPWLTQFERALRTMQGNLAGTESLNVWHQRRGRDAAIADTAPAGGGRWFRPAWIRFNDNGRYNWRTIAPALFDEYVFHELIHLADATYIDDDSLGDLWNVHSIQGMINTGIAGNTFYKYAKRIAIEECNC